MIRSVGVKPMVQGIILTQIAGGTLLYILLLVNHDIPVHLISPFSQ